VKEENDRKRRKQADEAEVRRVQEELRVRDDKGESSTV
jgi:hypothetical protein